MSEERQWVSSARLRLQREGKTPPECVFYPCAAIPPESWRRAAFDAAEDARRKECDEYFERWENGEEIADIKQDIESRKRARVESGSESFSEPTKSEQRRLDRKKAERAKRFGRG